MKRQSLGGQDSGLSFVEDGENKQTLEASFPFK